MHGWCGMGCKKTRLQTSSFYRRLSSFCRTCLFFPSFEKQACKKTCQELPAKSDYDLVVQKHRHSDNLLTARCANHQLFAAADTVPWSPDNEMYRSHQLAIARCFFPHMKSIKGRIVLFSSKLTGVFTYIFYFHPFLGQDFQFYSYFPTRLKPPTRKVSYLSLLFFSVCPTDHAGCAGMSHVKTLCLVRELIRERRPQAA